MSITQEISLSKTVYGTKGTRDFLDEEFTEFKIKKYTTEEFLTEYHNLFYEMPNIIIWYHNYRGILKLD